MNIYEPLRSGETCIRGIYEQQRPRSACATAQTDQGPRCPSIELLGTVKCNDI